ncbi:MAG: hypothetical protein ABMA25_20595 [Ilumatobacteraceae bacterium]
MGLTAVANVVHARSATFGLSAALATDTEAKMSARKRSAGETASMVIVIVLALVAAFSTYSYIGTHLVTDRASIYVLVFAAPIGMLALVDLVSSGRHAGATYRAGLGVAGAIAVLGEREHLHLGVAFVSSYLLYAMSCVLGLMAWRRRSMASAGE